MSASLMLRWPNVGQPCLVRVEENQDIAFTSLVGLTTVDLDVQSLLAGKLYLQGLPDTRRLFQDTPFPRPAWTRSLTKFPPSLRARLVPLEIENVEPPVSSPWHWVPSEPLPDGSMDDVLFPYACRIHLRISWRIARCLDRPQLYNIICDRPEAGTYEIKFHSLYLHEKNWHDFRFFHATDTHVAWRNDHIPERLSILGTSASGFINFNERFRQFIAYANTLHREHELDFILLTGDLIDYIFEESALRPVSIWNYPGASPRHQRTNFEYLRDVIIARSPSSLPGGKGIVIGEELEVPVFTVLGNHDYRVNEYPLIFQLHVPALYDEPQAHHDDFGLNEDQAKTFEGGLHEHGVDEAAAFVQYVKNTPVEYLTTLNPDSSYVVPLGSHRLVCLDTYNDIVASVWDFLKAKIGFGEDTKKDFISGSPDSYGFVDSQIDLLENALSGASGRIIVACHAPPLNMRGPKKGSVNFTPHHLMRKTEHAVLSEDEQVTLIYEIVENRPSISVGPSVNLGLCMGRVLRSGFSPERTKSPPRPGEQEIGRNTGQWLEIKVLGGRLKIDGLWYAFGQTLSIGSFGGPWRIIAPIKPDDYVTVFEGMDQLDSQFWVWMRVDLPELVYKLNVEPGMRYFSLLPSGYFKSKDRDPALGAGVAHHNFDRFARAITGKAVVGKKVDLVLSGHTHQSIEFALATENNKLRYFHDYYLDNTLYGLSANQFWRRFSRDLTRDEDWKECGFFAADAPPTMDTLKDAVDKSNWWDRHRPLLIQTLSLGPNPKHYPLYPPSSSVSTSPDTFAKTVRPTPEAGGLLFHVKEDLIFRVERIGLSDMAARIEKRRPTAARLVHWIMA